RAPAGPLDLPDADRARLAVGLPGPDAVVVPAGMLAATPRDVEAVVVAEPGGEGARVVRVHAREDGLAAGRAEDGLPHVSPEVGQGLGEQDQPGVVGPDPLHAPGDVVVDIPAGLVDDQALVDGAVAVGRRHDLYELGDHQPGQDHRP